MSAMPSRIPVLVCDDDGNIRKILRKMIEKNPAFEVVGEAGDGETALKLFDDLMPKVVFLDVDMPYLTGVECAREIQDRSPECILIFATGHEEYMSEAFRVYAFDYLVKPFDVARVQETLERISRTKESRETVLTAVGTAPQQGKGPSRLMLRHRDGVTLLNPEEILLIQREDRATVVYTRDSGRYVISDTLGELEARLDKSMFMRCHKSYIVNLNHIRDISPYGRWTYVVRLEGTKQDALITHDKFEELKTYFA